MKVEKAFVPEKYKNWLHIQKTGWRLAIGFFFMAFLSLFLQIKEARVDIVELNSTAKQYVVAQTSFEYFDEAKTQFLQQQASQDVGFVYRFDTKELSKASQDFEEYLSTSQSWRRKMPEATFEQFYENVEAFEDFLLESRFTDQRTLGKLKEVEGSEHPFVISEDGKEEVSLPSNYWDYVKQTIFPSKDPLFASYILDFFEKREWKLQRDLTLEKKIKLLAQENVPPQYTLVKAGSLILEPGDKISLKHVNMLQAMKNALGDPLYFESPLSIIGSLSLSLIITFLTGIYLRLYHKEIFFSLRKLCLLTVIAICTLFLAKLTEYLLLYNGYNLVEVIRYPLVIPFASLLLCVLLGPRISLFSSIFLSVIISLGLTIEYEHFLILNLIAAMCTIMFARGMHKRKDIFEVCAKVWLCTIPVLLSFHLIENDMWEISQIADFVTALAFLGATAILVVGLLPLFETMFKVMTDMTLMEFMDPNNELLRRLSLEAPGTYQHSLVVGNLAEVAARSIGANDLFCRVAALYHDAGKLFNPHYFTENQLGGFNIHQLLTPLESTHVIMAHVPEGEILARKHHLPQSFIDVIREHHGTTLVYFFYCKQIEQMNGDSSRVNPKQFRYPGPKPRTKESALIMIADSVEAASRSLGEVTEETLLEYVRKIVSEKAEEGQFDECPLTFQELDTVKKAIAKALLVTRHLRIKYPEKLA